MKNISNKKSLLFWAMVTSVVAVAIVSIIPTISLSQNSEQNALALSALESKKTASQTNQNKKDISGKRIIGVTITEHFEEKEHARGDEKSENSHKDEIKQEIFIDGKGYEFIAENINIELSGGIYEVSGNLDLKTNVVTLTKAKFLEEVSDGTPLEVNENKKLTDTNKKPKPRKVAVFLFNYLDSSSKEIFPYEVENMMFGGGDFASYFREASYNRQEISGDVFGWNLIQTDATPVCQATMQNLETAVTNHNVDLNNYTNIVLISMCPGFTRYGSSNTSPVPHIINGTTYNKVMTWANVGTESWDQKSSQMVFSMDGDHMLNNLEHLLVHEFGHALGLQHAHGLQCEGTLPTENCQGVGLGNYFDTMAYDTIGLHFNAWSKAKLGWFPSGELKTITSSGIYTVTPLAHTNTSLNNATTAKAFKIKPSLNSNKTPIWIEFRNSLGYDGGLSTPALGGYLGGGGQVPPHNIAENMQGIFVYKEGFDTSLGGQLNPRNARLMYLRNAPNLGSSSNPFQVSLNPGQTYTEPRYGLSVTTLTSTNQGSRRFQVNMNPNFACVRLAPKVNSWYPPNTTISAGSVFNTWLHLTNYDYLSCPSSNFTVTLGQGLPASVVPNNFNATSLTTFISNLSPDDERIFGPQVYFGPGTPPGNYTIPIIITNTSSGLSTTKSFNVTVQ